ncbi:type II secretion system F family protein [Planctomicrobium sp. SH527]|uniref:type II secretion system F family protein n=1 Tax=Planctomicrobium sp. SH527 TaxID=3448123 RepID=UPI003F5BA204
MAVSIIKPHSEFAGILREDERFSVENDTSVGNQINGWFDRLMLQSGLEIAPGTMLILSVFTGLTFAGFVFVWQENFLTMAMMGFIGFLLPSVIAMLMRSRRQSLILRQMPPMIEELARAARTGRSLENCLGIVAYDTPNPLGAELRHCTRKLALGLKLDESLQELPKRTGLVATSVLATALSVHRQTGGDLVAVLSRLAMTLRDRIQFQGRLKAATAASRATAILMITLPPAIIAFFVFRDPNYLTELFDSTWGLRTTIIAFVLEVIGVVWVIRVLQTSQRG